MAPDMIFEVVLRSVVIAVPLGVGAAEVVDGFPMGIVVETPESVATVGIASGGEVADVWSALEVWVVESEVDVSEVGASVVDVSCVDVVSGASVVVVVVVVTSALVTFVAVGIGGSDVVVGSSCCCLMQTP